MELRGGFIGCMPGGMLVDPGEIGLALDAQLVLRWRFLFASGFCGLPRQAWQAPKYSVRRDCSHWTQVGMIMDEHRIRPERYLRQASGQMGWSGHHEAFSRRDASEVCRSIRTSRKERAQGMPDARCTRGLVCMCTRRCAHEHTGQRRQSDIPCARESMGTKNIDKSTHCG